LFVAVIGAGIGGLAAAAALRQVGGDAAVYEQTERFARVGAGIQQSPNAMKVHRRLGIEERLRAVAFSPASALSRDAISGAVTNDFTYGKRAEDRYGAPYLTMHRGDLHAALASTIPPDCLHLGKRLVGIEWQGVKVALQFAGGTSVRADAVIAADGTHSFVRDAMLGPEQPRYTGRLAYRTTFAASRLRGVEVDASSTKWWGRDRHIVIYFVTADRSEVYFTTSQPEKADWITRESWSTKGDLGELREAFSSFHRDVRAVLDAAPEAHKWGILERDPLPSWSKGRAVLLGDACHPMTPYMASGAAMALEDAAVLARCFNEMRGERVEDVFRTFEATRKPRTSAVQAGSSTNTWMRSETSADWVYGYDAWTVPLAASARVA